MNSYKNQVRDFFVGVFDEAVAKSGTEMWRRGFGVRGCETGDSGTWDRGGRLHSRKVGKSDYVDRKSRFLPTKRNKHWLFSYVSYFLFFSLAIFLFHRPANHGKYVLAGYCPGGNKHTTYNYSEKNGVTHLQKTLYHIRPNLLPLQKQCFVRHLSEIKLIGLDFMSF